MDSRNLEVELYRHLDSLNGRGVLMSGAVKPDVTLTMESEPSPEELQMFRAELNMALSRAMMHRSGAETMQAIRGKVASDILSPEKAATIPEQDLMDTGTFTDSVIRAKFSKLEVTPPVVTFDISEWVVRQTEEAGQTEGERDRLLAISILPQQFQIRGEPGDDFLEHGVNSAKAMLELLKRLKRRDK